MRAGWQKGIIGVTGEEAHGSDAGKGFCSIRKKGRAFIKKK